MNGFRVSSKAELLKYTMILLGDQALIERLGASAQKKAQIYTRAKFEARVRDFFDAILKTYVSGRETRPFE
jgi:hypothetical protein